MAFEKIVKTRKEHICISCDKTIPTGTKAMFFSEKQPRFDADDKQIGIEYFKGYYCYSEELKMAPSCQLCQKEYVEEVCDNCDELGYELVSHPGGESTASVKKYYCKLGIWQEEF